MFEAKLGHASLMKHILDAIKELVSDVNFDCDEDGMKLQAMDNSHVALVALQLRSSGFNQYRCDRTMTLGTNIPSFHKIVRCSASDDILTLRAQDDADLLNIVFETPNTDRVAEYEMKLMDIDIEHLGIPETIYDAEIALPSSEFNRIIRDLTSMGESVRIEATKEGVKFSASGDIGKGAVMLKHTAVAKKGVAVKDKKKALANDDDDDDDDDDDEDDKEEDQESEHEAEEDQEVEQVRPKKEAGSDDDDAEGGKDEQHMDGKEAVEEDEEDELPKAKKRKVASKKKPKKTTTNGDVPKSKALKKEPKQSEEEDLSVSISLVQSVSLTFSIKYLSNFTKATPLAGRVTLHMSNEVPLLVAYEFETGFVRYYLAPKIEED